MDDDLSMSPGAISVALYKTSLLECDEVFDVSLSVGVCLGLTSGLTADRRGNLFFGVVGCLLIIGCETGLSLFFVTGKGFLDTDLFFSLSGCRWLKVIFMVPDLGATNVFWGVQ